MLFKEKKNCCACGACVQICPKHAISFEPDESGFLYPIVDETRCVHCGLCEKVCSFRRDLSQPRRLAVYAAAAENIDRAQSASGGVFAGLAAKVIESGGVVFGSAMQYDGNQITVRHRAVHTLEDLIHLQGSKYVQSAIGDCYCSAREMLEKGDTVLFSGTPCQIAGLHTFLRKDYANLYTVDIVCHGVPSEKIFQDYLAFEEHKIGKRIEDFRFRDKSRGWKLFGRMSTADEQGRVSEVFFEPEESSYYQLFLNGYTYRENCYLCPYAGGYRPGDLTIGDFWGIEVVQPELLKQNGGPLDEEKGVSCLIVNTDRGMRLLKSVPEIRLYDSSFEKAKRYNGQLREPSKLKPERETALALYREGYERLEKWYRRRLAIVRIKRGVRRAIPKWVKRGVRKLMGRHPAG